MAILATLSLAEALSWDFMPEVAASRSHTELTGPLCLSSLMLATGVNGTFLQALLRGPQGLQMLSLRPGGLGPPGPGLVCKPITFWERPWAQPGLGRHTENIDVTRRSSRPRTCSQNERRPRHAVLEQRGQQSGVCPAGHGPTQCHTSPL